MKKKTLPRKLQKEIFDYLKDCECEVAVCSNRQCYSARQERTENAIQLLRRCWTYNSSSEVLKLLRRCKYSYAATGLFHALHRMLVVTVGENYKNDVRMKVDWGWIVELNSTAMSFSNTDEKERLNFYFNSESGELWMIEFCNNQSILRTVLAANLAQMKSRDKRTLGRVLNIIFTSQEAHFEKETEKDLRHQYGPISVFYVENPPSQDMPL